MTAHEAPASIARPRAEAGRGNGDVARALFQRDLALAWLDEARAEARQFRDERDAAREDSACHRRSVLDLRRAVASLVIG